MADAAPLHVFSQTLVLVESVRTLEHAFKTLDVIVRHLENRAGMDVNDCE